MPYPLTLDQQRLEAAPAGPPPWPGLTTAYPLSAEDCHAVVMGWCPPSAAGSPQVLWPAVRLSASASGPGKTWIPKLRIYDREESGAARDLTVDQLVELWASSNQPEWTKTIWLEGPHPLQPTSPDGKTLYAMWADYISGRLSLDLGAYKSWVGGPFLQTPSGKLFSELRDKLPNATFAIDDEWRGDPLEVAKGPEPNVPPGQVRPGFGAGYYEDNRDTESVGHLRDLSGLSQADLDRIFREPDWRKLVEDSAWHRWTARVRRYHASRLEWLFSYLGFSRVVSLADSAHLGRAIPGHAAYNPYQPELGGGSPVAGVSAVKLYGWLPDGKPDEDWYRLTADARRLAASLHAGDHRTVVVLQCNDLDPVCGSPARAKSLDGWGWGVASLGSCFRGYVSMRQQAPTQNPQFVRDWMKNHTVARTLAAPNSLSHGSIPLALPAVPQYDDAGWSIVPWDGFRNPVVRPAPPEPTRHTVTVEFSSDAPISVSVGGQR